jgi:hypothetical protein
MSGVLVETPNVPPPLGSFMEGTAKSARLKRLKNSSRNWALYRSLNFQFFATERSVL